MALSVKIAGVERAQDVPLRSLVPRNALTSEVDTCDFDVVSGAAPQVGQEVIVEDEPLSTVVTSQADWQAGTLPPQVEATAGGDLRLYRAIASFARNSTRFLPDGSSVTANNPGFWWGRFHNLLTANQADVEVDNTAWSTNTTFSRVTDKAWHGDYSIKFNSETPQNNASATARFVVTPGKTYVFSAYVWKELTAGNGYFDWVEYADGSTGTVAVDGYGSGPLANVAAWTRRWFSFTPANPYVQLRCVCDSNAIGAVWFDGFQLEEATVKDGTGNWIPTDWRPGGVKGAVMGEEGTTTLAENALFANPSGGVPQNYAPFVNDGTGSHSTTSGEYRATLSITTTGLARIGVYGSWRFVALSDTISVQVKARVVSGSCVARLRVQFTDSGQSTILAEHQVVTTMTADTVLKIENKSAVGQVYVRILLDAYANGNAANIGTVAFSKPSIEKKAYCTSFHDGTRASETLTIPKGQAAFGAGTLRFWFNPWNNKPGQYPGLVSIGKWTQPVTDDWISVYWGSGWSNGGVFQFSIYSAAGVQNGNRAITLIPSPMTWYYIVAKWDFETKQMRLVIYNPDGSKLSSTMPDLIGTAPAMAAYNEWYLLQTWNNGGSRANALIDEFEWLGEYTSDTDDDAAYQRTAPEVAGLNHLAYHHMDGNLTSDYPSQATVITRTLDLGRAPERSGVLRITATTPAGTSAQVQEVRSSADGQNWGPWIAVGPGGEIPAAVERCQYYQVRLLLATTDPNQTPVLSDLTLTFDEDEENGREFGGQIVAATQAEPVPGGVTYLVHCVDWTRQADALFVNENYTDKTRGYIARDIVAKYCPGFTAIVGNVPDGPTISGEYRITYKKPSQVFQELCEATGGDWYWDPHQDLHMFDVEAAAAPFRISDDATADAEHPADLTWTPDITDLATRVYVRGGDYFPPFLYPQQIRCDGTARAWNLNYKPKDLTVTIGGVPKVVAVDDLLNQPEDADFTYNFQEKLLKVGPDKPTPADGTILDLEYRPYLPVRLRLDDPDAQAALAALDGSDGVYEATIVDESLDSTDMARTVGQAFLSEHANPVITGGYSTLRNGMRAGQIQTVAMSARGISSQVLIGAVTKRRLPGGRWRSEITFASRLQGGIADLLVRLLRDRRRIEFRSDEILEIVKAFKSPAQASDTCVVTAVAPQIAQADSARADRCEVA